MNIFKSHAYMPKQIAIGIPTVAKVTRNKAKVGENIYMGLRTDSGT